MPRLPIFASWRARLILASMLIQSLMLVVVLVNTANIWDETARNATEVRISELSRILNITFAPPLANGDIAQAADLLESIRAPEGIDYLVLIDNKGRVLAARGWDLAQSLPPIDAEPFSEKMPVLVNARTELSLGSEKLGELRFGVSTEALQRSASQLLWQGSLTLIAGMVTTLIALSLLSLWLARRMSRLIEATRLASEGIVEMLPEAEGHDEVADLTRRFNEMSMAIKERIDAISRNEEQFHAIADYTHNSELWLDPAGKLVWANASIERLTGYSVNECLLLRDFPLPLALPEERSRIDADLKKALTERTSTQDYEFRAVRRDGVMFWVSCAWQPIYDRHGRHLGLRASLRDNSELKEDRLALRKAVMELRQMQMLGESHFARAETERARLNALLAAMRFGVLFVDNDNRVVFHNPAFADLWGLQASSTLIGRPIGQILQQSENRPTVDELMACYLEELLHTEERSDYGEIIMNDGRVVTQHCYRVLDQKGQTNGRMWIYEDVTQTHLLTERMIKLAERDALTGLYNRHRFQQELERMVSEAERRQSSMALIFFDLDEFKHVNDTFGHDIGDRLLETIAHEIGNQVRRHEVLARLGGDEFAVLVPDCTEFEISKLAERVVTTVSQIQFNADGHALRPSTSVGVAMYPQHAAIAAELVAHADSAMYQAKAAGKSTWRMYHPDADVSKHAIVRMSWKDRIVEALENDGFELHFQGIYRWHDKSLAHLEALLRMKDTRTPGGLIYPGNFIQHAESTGKIIDIDRWVTTRAVEMLGRNPGIPSIAVNISGRSLDEPELPEFINRLLMRNRVAPHRLLVELTETSAVSDMRDAQRFIDALRSTGCTVCLDDFGNGFASFAYLKQLKADVLKIDGLFIRDLPNDRDSQIFVRGMVAMARDMGKTTIAEFVENEQIFNMLGELGIDQVQGYYLDRPQRDHPGLAGAIQS